MLLHNSVTEDPTILAGLNHPELSLEDVDIAVFGIPYDGGVSFRSGTCEAAYSASKGAVNSLTRALAKELGPSHISVNAISLGVIDTAMNQCFNEEERQALAEEIPFGRFASPGEAAAFCCQIAESPEYLTGQILRFDGGWI